jgi:hypothetical protein
MATGIYNGFKGDLRDKVGQLQELLIRDGYMPPHDKCYLCNQTQGRILYHLEDYTKVLDSSMPMCFMCHMMLHCCIKRRPDLWEAYQKEVCNGYQYLLQGYEVQRLFDELDKGNYHLEKINNARLFV